MLVLVPAQTLLVFSDVIAARTCDNSIASARTSSYTILSITACSGASSSAVANSCTVLLLVISIKHFYARLAWRKKKHYFNKARFLFIYYREVIVL